MKKPKIGSLFDGSGGFPLAASMCGIIPAWASEVEPYPIAVTKSRFPKMKHLGDISKINGAEIEPVDIITFGSPCQDLSVAGKRAGLKHEANGDEETTRSGLFMEAVRIIKEMREATNGTHPRFALWENVPGAFSSNKGEDFRIVLEELIKIVEPSAVMPEVPQKGWPYADSYCGDGWSISYRVFDAQYWGVPQRRRRIHLVLDLAGECAQKVLFECESLRGYFAESGQAWEATTSHAEGSIGTADYEGTGVGIINLNKDDVQSKAVLDPSGIAPSLYAGECRYGGGECYVLDKESAPVGFDSYNLCETGEIGRTVTTASGGLNEHIPCVYYNAVPYTLKIRSGVAVDSGGKVAGKGALIQTDKAATLATTNDQYLFQPIAVATQQGGAEITENGICPTITASAGMSGNNQPWICKPYGISSYESNAMKSSNPHSGIYEADTARTLDINGGNPACNQGGIAIVEQMETIQDACSFEPGAASRLGGYVWDDIAGTLRAMPGDNQLSVCYSVENHPADSRVTLDESGKVQTLTSRMGTGGGNVPMVMEAKPTFCIEGNGQRESHRGDGYIESDTMYTLNTVEHHAVAYAENPIVLDRAFYNQGENAQYEPQYYEDGTVPTLVARGPSAVTYGLETFHCTAEEEKSPTLKARDWKDPHVVTYWDGSQTCGTLTANNAGGNQRMPDKDNFNCVIEGHNKPAVRYIVRRLTPTECARLQGFADRWGDIDAKDDFTDEEYKFWLEVRNTHAAINGKATKEYTKAQMLTWYNKLHTDSAEYKMWGNGIALPPALFCMRGIAEVLRER